MRATIQRHMPRCCGVLVLAALGCSVFPDRVELPAGRLGSAGAGATSDAAAPSTADAASGCGIRTIVLDATADTYLSSSSDTNYGTEAEMLVGRSRSGDEQRALVDFDLASALAGGAQPVAMRLDLTLARPGNADETLAAFAVGVAWSETQATWTLASSGAPWSTAGGDIAPSAAASASIPRNAAAGDGVAWALPATRPIGVVGVTGSVSDGSTTRYGWLIRGADAAADFPTSSFVTREGGRGAPRLEVDVRACD